MCAKKSVSPIQSITYPISVSQYVSYWNTWDIVREIVSNALDTQTPVKITRENDNLVISDNGTGFSIEALIMGISTKPDETAIGQFGEGLKIGLLVCSRLNIDVEIYTSNLKFWNETTKIGNTDVLKICYQETGKHVVGTKVILKSWYPENEDYKDRFLFTNPQNILISTDNGNILVNPQSDIYVKGVSLASNPGFSFSYNITSNSVKMNRDRKSVNMSDLFTGIGEIWNKIEDSKLWVKFWESVKSGKHENSVYLSRHNMTNETFATCQHAFYRTFGTKPALVQDDSEYSEIKHRGYTPIFDSIFGGQLRWFVRDFVPYAYQILEELNKQEIIWVSSHKMDDTQKDTISTLRKVCKRYGFDSKMIRGANLSNHHARGLYNPRDGFIYIDVSCLYDLVESIGILLHEISHAVTNGNDLTDTHVRGIQSISGKIIASYSKHDF